MVVIGNSVLKFLQGASINGKYSYESSLLNDSDNKRSPLTWEMSVLLEEFGACFHWDKATKLIPRIYEQGKKDGLSKESIRELIFLHFKGGLSDRQLRRLLPLELKYTEFANNKRVLPASLFRKLVVT